MTTAPETAGSPDTFDMIDSAGVRLVTYRWAPARAPKAAVVLLHGMGEHARRYQHVALELTASGFVVYAYDQRGHGASIAGEPGDLGDWSALVSDIIEFAHEVRRREPGLRVGIVAHSMGSFACQQALVRGGGTFDAVALTGTAALDLLEPALDLDAPLDLAMFNAPFDAPRTDFDWLSRDAEMVDAYIDDPLCGFGIDPQSTRAMFVGARALAEPAIVESIPSDLPIRLAVGDADPVNAGLTLFEPLLRRMRAAGLSDVTSVVYPGARHEILNETNRAEVLADLSGWLTARLAQDD